MKKQMHEKGYAKESGNVLFLILIAVALFAALSYAVTQSTRSGAGDTSSETNLISSASLTQYPAGVRTSIVRMIIAGAAVEDLVFNTPSDFGGDISTASEINRAVFHPNGGNATYQLPPNDIVPTGQTWNFNLNAQIQNIGLTDASDEGGNDLIAWLPNINDGVCRRMNDELGIGNVIPTVAGLAATVADQNMNISGYTLPSGGGQPVISGGSNEFVGQPFGCFEDSANSRNVYFHTLIER